MVGEEQLEQMDEELNELSDSLKEATHHSKLEPKTLKVLIHFIRYDCIPVDSGYLGNHIMKSSFFVL